MKSYLTFWLVLVGLLTLAYLTATKTDFVNYMFVPRRWGWGWGGRNWLYDGSVLGPWRGRRWRSTYPHHPRWGYVTYIEPFEGSGDKPGQVDASGQIKKPSDSLMEYQPGDPAPVSRSPEPYQLLNDELPSVGPPEHISCVNSRSCYAGDFSRLLEKTGNYRQMTNNYKHGYPDSCSAPIQELTMAFYKNTPMSVPVKANCL